VVGVVDCVVGGDVVVVDAVEAVGAVGGAVEVTEPSVVDEPQAAAPRPMPTSRITRTAARHAAFRIIMCSLHHSPNGNSLQPEQPLGPCLPTPGALGVIPTHRQAALRASPTLFFILDPLLDAHLTHLRKVRQVLATVQKTDIHQVRDAIAGQLFTAGATSVILFFRGAEPDGTVPAMRRELAAAEATVAAKAIHPVRVGDRLRPVGRLR